MNRRGANRTGPLGGSGLVGQWGASSMVRSIQRATITTSGTSGAATITAVDLNNSLIRKTGYKTTALDTNAELYWWNGRAELTNATTVSAYINTAGSSWTLSFEVIEFHPGVLKSIQRGTLAYTSLSGSNFGIATITSVDTSKAFLDVLGETSTYTIATVRPDFACQTAAITSATTVQFLSSTDPNGSGGTWTIGYQVAEFF